jgi:hypothetical protein
MKQSFILTPLVAIFLVFFSGCDKGLEPLNEPSGFGGVIHYKNWPGPDSLLELRIAAFTEYPSDSSGILAALLSGRAVVYPQVGGSVQGALIILGGDRRADTVRYDFTTKGTTLQVTAYNYVVMAWRYGPNYFTDWRPAGVYVVNPDTFDPAPVRVLLHRITSGIDIYVDFHNLPPKPWR